MKLLLVTQVVDQNHPVLGFFHRWIIEFAKHCESIEVICLQAGSYNLPENVTVHSLGKEEGVSRLVYIYRLYRHSWQLRDRYDGVFVHMNQIYVLLVGLLWRCLGKRVGLWYAHGTVTNSLRLAVVLAQMVFTSTAEGMRVRTKKRIITGQGIDPLQFDVSDRSLGKQIHLVTVGRVGTSKHIDTLLRAVALLKEQEIDCRFTIIGGPATPAEEKYAAEMRDLSKTLVVDNCVTWMGPQSYEKLPAFLAEADIFIHDGATNSLDKTLVEAAFSGCVVVSSNPSYVGMTKSIAPELLFPPQDHAALASCILAEIKQPSDNVANVRAHLLATCGLERLITLITAQYTQRGL